MKCTETCLAKCEVLRPLADMGMNLEQASEVVAAAAEAAYLPYYDCASGAPVAMSKGTGERCDLRMEIQYGVGAVVVALERGIVRH